MYQSIKKVIKSLFDKENQSLTKQTIENSAYSFGINIVSKLGGIIFSILLARILLPDLYGLYSLVFSVVVTISAFTDLGVNSALSRYLAESLSKGKKFEDEARSRVRFLFNLKVILSFGISLILFLLSTVIATAIFHKPEMALPLRMGSIYLLVLSIQGFFAMIFYPLKKLKYGLFAEVIFQVAKIGLFLLFIKMYLSVSNVFLAMALAFFISAAFYFLIILFKHKKLFFGKLVKIEKRKITIFLGWITLFTAFSSLYSTINTLVLGFFVDNNFVAYYSAILSIVLPLSVVINLGGIVLPIFTEITGKRLKRGFKKIVKYSAIVSIPSSVGLAFILIPVLRVIYGPSYVPPEFYNVILISTILLSMLVFEELFISLYLSLFAAKEKFNRPTISFILMTVLNIVLDYILIKLLLPYGQIWAVLAVSIATLVTRYLNLLILGALAKKEFRLGLNKRTILSPLLASLIMLGFLFLFNWIFNPNLILTIIMVGLAIILYFIFLFLIENFGDKKAKEGD